MMVRLESVEDIAALQNKKKDTSLKSAGLASLFNNTMKLTDMVTAFSVRRKNDDQGLQTDCQTIAHTAKDKPYEKLMVFYEKNKKSVKYTKAYFTLL